MTEEAKRTILLKDLSWKGLREDWAAEKRSEEEGSGMNLAWKRERRGGSRLRLDVVGLYRSGRERGRVASEEGEKQE